jgi:predicted flap endonuclease-1-like 5' DNA nuclease
MNTNTLIIYAAIGILLLLLLYQIFTSGSKPAPKKKKVAVKPEEILRPEPEPEPTLPPEPEPEPVVYESDPEPEPEPIFLPEPMTEEATDPQPVKEEAPSVQSSSGYQIIDIEGIGAVYAATLNSLGIYTTEDLLVAGATRRGRDELAENSEISPYLILEWVNLSDLFRIRGVAEEYSDLLEEAGVDTVPELAQRVPENLLARLEAINAEKNLVRRTPSLSMVEDWITPAKKLPRRIEY